MFWAPSHLDLFEFGLWTGSLCPEPWALNLSYSFDWSFICSMSSTVWDVLATPIDPSVFGEQKLRRKSMGNHNGPSYFLHPPLASTSFAPKGGLPQLVHFKYSVPFSACCSFKCFISAPRQTWSPLVPQKLVAHHSAASFCRFSTNVSPPNFSSPNVLVQNVNECQWMWLIMINRCKSYMATSAPKKDHCEDLPRSAKCPSAASAPFLWQSHWWPCECPVMRGAPVARDQETKTGDDWSMFDDALRKQDYKIYSIEQTWPDRWVIWFSSDHWVGHRVWLILEFGLLS